MGFLPQILSFYHATIHRADLCFSTPSLSIRVHTQGRNMKQKHRICAAEASTKQKHRFIWNQPT